MYSTASVLVALAGLAARARGLGLATEPAADVRVAAEGDALMAELANEVLSNKEELLPSPWDVVVNTPTDRDVGSVIEHPISDKYAVEMAPDSLETGREIEGYNPMVAIGRMVVKESRKSTQPPPACRMTGKCGQAVRHLNGMVNPDGPTTVWGWQRLRAKILKDWTDVWTQRNAQKIVAIHYSGEVLYAGCSENTILYKYNQIIAAAGNTSTIVMAAEVSPFHPELGYRYDLAETAIVGPQRNASLEAFGLPLNWASTYADCTDPKAGACNSPPKYQYANPAFIIGPVSDIAEMFEGMQSFWDDSEHRYLTEYFLKNSDKVTLDYAGVLAMSLHNMKLAPSTIPVTVASDANGKKSFNSRLTGGKVCFVIGGGNAFSTLKGLATELLM